MTKQPKILIWDIETLPAIAYIFDIFQGTNPDWVIQEGSIVTIAYRWLGEEKAKVLSVTDFPKTFKANVYDDTELLKAFLEIMNEADYTVAHYGDKFDMRMFNGRVFRAGLTPTAPTKQLDTWKLVKRHFKFQSNKLDYIGKALGLGGKIKTSGELWLKCAKGDKDAIKDMATYNAQDVDLLHDVFLKLLPYVKTTLNLCDESHDEASCSKCGSHNVHKRGFVATAGGKRQRYQCNDCGGWSSDANLIPLNKTTRPL